MTNLSHDEHVQLDAAIARIVDEHGNANDWRVIVEASKVLGNDVVMGMAKDAANKLRKSRICQ